MAGVITLFLGRDGAILGAMVFAASLVARLTGKGSVVRRYTNLAKANFVPGQVQAIRFGPDALDTSSSRGRTRMYYSDIRSVYTGYPGAVVLRYRGGLLALPQQLLPEWSIGLITAARRGGGPVNESAVTELPPIPTVEKPTATFVARTDTAGRMARTHTPYALRPLLGTALALAAMPLGVALLAHNRLGIAIVLALLVVIAGFLAMVAVTTLRQLTESYGLAVPPGLPLTVRYGSDAVDFQQAGAWTRTPYSSIRSITLRGPIAVVTTTRPTVCPRELIPDHALAHMCAVNPRIVVKR
ncbi:hypothetical protein VMT65_21350 [Nocardia sp. CDC153]|uniref:hypothetical protein n=1 Tax=Nocardia sp. CDC153 TaxID=3112167 RepID=UPI002DB79E90|nr:hypothetical protein [Nocardia sp. CDC153]MEC3955599.1 hypothetical protein [Nocardia sp. CDC153]